MLFIQFEVKEQRHHQHRPEEEKSVCGASNRGIHLDNSMMKKKKKKKELRTRRTRRKKVSHEIFGFRDGRMDEFEVFH